MEALQGRVLKLGEDRKKLCISVELFIDWQANKNLPWSAYHAFVSGCLITLENNSIVCPVGVGETWRFLFSKFVLNFTGTKSTNMCHYYQICSELKEVIDRALHGVQVIWDANSSTENWGFLLVDTKKAFNEINIIGMLWIFRHLFPSGDHFVINCYPHWSLLVLRNGNGTDSFLHSRESVTQGYSLATIAYGIDVLLLIK